MKNKYVIIVLFSIGTILIPSCVGYGFSGTITTPEGGIIPISVQK